MIPFGSRDLSVWFSSSLPGAEVLLRRCITNNFVLGIRNTLVCCAFQASLPRGSKHVVKCPGAVFIFLLKRFPPPAAAAVEVLSPGGLTPCSSSRHMAGGGLPPPPAAAVALGLRGVNPPRSSNWPAGRGGVTPSTHPTAWRQAAHGHFGSSLLPTHGCCEPIAFLVHQLNQRS